MKQPNLVLPFLATLAAIGLVLKLSYHEDKEASTPIHARELAATTASNHATAEPPSALAANPSPSTEAIGEGILRDYGNPSNSPQNDLKVLSQLMDNFLLLVKPEVDRPLSDNDDWSRALRGANPARERFLPEHHAILNEQGQLIDRWGTPLFFHSLGRGQFSIRSAGPDRKMWTQDDIVCGNESLTR